MSDTPADDKAGPLAVYTALRAESLQCSQQMSALFGLLIATVGFILAFALRPSVAAANVDPPTAIIGPSLAVLITLPAVSYLTCARYVYLYLGTVRIGHFISQDLIVPVPALAEWETYLANSKSRVRMSQTLSDGIAFLGTSLLGLIGSAYAFFFSPTPPLHFPVAVALLVGGGGLFYLTARLLATKRGARKSLAGANEKQPGQAPEAAPPDAPTST